MHHPGRGPARFIEPDMRIEAKVALLPLVLGWLLPTAAAQRIITDRPSPKPAPSNMLLEP